jgi:multiple sugar transport system permease protein
VILQVGGGIAVALFIWRRYPNAKILRAILLLPMLISEVVVGNVWRLMLNSNGGLIDGVLRLLDLPTPLWLGPRWAFVSIVVADLWQQLPFVFLVVFAALQSVPDELLESATMDGSRGWQSLWNVIIPLIRPAILLVLLFETLYALRTFSTVYILTEGGPAGETTLFGVSIEQTALSDYKVGLAAALSWVLLAISLVFAIVYIRWLKRDPLG